MFGGISTACITMPGGRFSAANFSGPPKLPRVTCSTVAMRLPRGTGIIWRDCVSCARKRGMNVANSGATGLASIR